MTLRRISSFYDMFCVDLNCISHSFFSFFFTICFPFRWELFWLVDGCCRFDLNVPFLSAVEDCEGVGFGCTLGENFCS